MDKAYEQEDIELLHRWAIRDKQTVLTAIEVAIKKVKLERRESNLPSSYFERYLLLLEKFLYVTRQTIFIRELDPWWVYRIRIDEYGAKVTLEYEGWEPRDDGSYGESPKFVIARQDARLLSVEEYARAYGVTDTTVRQWIRRGKLLTATKYGAEWRIPELSVVKSGRYTTRCYQIATEQVNFAGDLEILNGFSTITISKASGKGSGYNVRLRADTESSDFAFNGGPVWHEYTVDVKQREELELKLMDNPFVYVLPAALQEFESKDDVVKFM